jgi:hypothetical protein
MKKARTGSSRAMPSKAVPPPPKSGPTNKIGVLKIAHPKAKPGPRGTSEIELALEKLVGVSKKFRLLDATGLSHRPHANSAATTTLSMFSTSTIPAAASSRGLQCAITPAK